MKSTHRLLLVWALVAGIARAENAASIADVDHIPIAVRDLAAAGERYRALGFTLKPGRLHDNSLNNLHAKNPNGSELELITATEPRDDLAKKYLAFIAAGDGPAFLALRADFDELEERLTAAKIPYERRGGYLLKPTEPALSYLFFGQDNRSPTDEPAHFDHANTSHDLVAVWIADNGNRKLIELLAALGAPISPGTLPIPGKPRAAVARLRASTIYLVAPKHRLIADRPIIGATLAAGDAAKVRGLLKPGQWIEQTKQPDVLTLVVKPEAAHGLWLEFRQSRL